MKTATKRSSRKSTAQPVVFEGDPDDIALRIIEQLGLTKLWDRHELSDEHDFFRDVLLDCQGLSYETWEHDGDWPGTSYTGYTVTIRDEAKVRAECAKAIEALIEAKAAG